MNISPESFAPRIKDVAPGLRVMVSEDAPRDEINLKLRYSVEFLATMVAYYSPFEIEERIRASIVAIQSKAIEDLGIDTEALKKVEELEGEVAAQRQATERAEEALVAANARLDAVLALVAKGAAS